MLSLPQKSEVYEGASSGTHFISQNFPNPSYKSQVLDQGPTINVQKVDLTSDQQYFMEVKSSDASQMYSDNKGKNNQIKHNDLCESSQEIKYSNGNGDNEFIIAVPTDESVFTTMDRRNSNAAIKITENPHSNPRVPSDSPYTQENSRF